MAYDSVQKIAENYRQSNPEYFKYFKDKVGKVTEHYASGLVEIIFRDAFKIEIAPEGWKTKNTLANELSVAERTVSRIADKYRESNPNYFKKFKLGNTGSVYEHFSPILADIVRAELLKVEKAPVGWKTNKKISNELSVSADAIKHVARDYLKTNPEYFKNYRDEGRRIFLHYSPELVQIIKNVIEAKKIEKVNGESEEKLKQSLEDFVQELSDKETNDEKAKKLREIISLLPENACDILFKYHPEYKGLHADYVRSVIAEYLGDFLLVRKAWETKDIKMAEELFFEEQFAEALFLKFKDASLAFFQKEKKSNPKANEYELVMRYFQNEKIQESALRIPELQKTIDRLKKYYAEIFQLAEKKPANIVDSLREGRVFPDINQLINIKELAEVRKKNEGKENEEDLGHKLLIADEMGLGKSASAILAKEYFGLKCAVIVMPSNVEETWQGYLSDNISDGGKQEGYFRKGSAPKVLTIENQKDLERLKTGVFDYILISQEKMAGEHYFEALRNFDFDMLIIDEVHKLKNIEEGVRSENVVRLSEKIQGQDKYLAMLSGTPIPNKVKDLAVILKLLYPERYKDSSDQYLINHIIYGDLMKLRQELFSRMQMKELTSSIEIPEPEFKDVRFDLSDEENEVYQILLEEDELTASGKIIMFRQFLLNPQLLGVEPGFEGSKVRELKEMLAEDLKSKNKIIVFVNSYIDGVIRDKEDKDTGEILTESIISKLNLPSGIKWKTIHGKDKDKDNYRKEVQKEFNADNEEKMILFVSGDTADVGVDFSGADELIFYNEPWSKYDKKQQEGRSQREGRRGVLVVKTLIARGTIEEGIRRYIDAKEKAIEKLLRGFDRTKSENNLLRKDANSKKRDLEADKDLSKDYISEWEKLMLHFGKGWEAGGRWFKEMPEDEKESYAKLYREAGGLSYQGNNARASVSLIEKMIAEKDKNGEKLRILDIASGPEMLKRHAAKDLHNQIYSMDINERHFDETIDARRTFKKSYLNLPVRSGSVDYYNIGFAFHQTKQIKFYKKNYERLQVLAEMNRVLKVGGRAIISEIHNAEFVNPGKLEELIEKLGFRMVKKYSGEADGGENYRSHFITLEKIAETPGYGSDMFRLSDEEKQAKIKELGEVLDKDLLNGLEIRKTAKSGRRLKDQRRMIEKFKLGNKEIKIAFTSEDEKLFLEEKKAIKDGEALSQRFDGKIYDIPLEEMYKIGFKRKLQNPNLMYRIIENGGAVVVRGDKKKRKNK
ncbi:MAG: SNF2-related protein [Parcubacteria group bacterium]